MMSSLSELLRCKEQLESFDASIIKKNDDALIDFMRDVMATNLDLDHRTMLSTLTKSVNIRRAVIVDLIIKINAHLDRNIQVLNGLNYASNIEWCANVNSRTYEEHKRWMRESYEQDVYLYEYYEDRIRRHCDWRSCALLWNVDDYTDLTIYNAFYPIYIVDKWMTRLLEDHPKTFVPSQSRKIRTYDQDFAYHHLPRACFGLVISRNHFTHCSINNIEKQISFLTKFLRPNGTLSFNFNDCEKSQCAVTFESGVRSFVLGKDIKKILNDNDLEITSWQHLIKSNTTWVEAKLSGNYRSIKRSECLGVITRKT